MEATTTPVPSSNEKTSRQVKSKQKSRSGCQSCKLRRLKCDETKPECSNCRKKGITCPGYALRLTWSTKYERPREPTRQEPSNFDQLISAVTQSIVPNEGHCLPSSPSQSVSSRPSEPDTPPALSYGKHAANVRVECLRPNQVRKHATPTATSTRKYAIPRSNPSLSPQFVKTETLSINLNSPDAIGFQASERDTGPYDSRGTPDSGFDGSLWGQSNNDASSLVSLSGSTGRFSDPSPGIDNMMTLAALSDVEEAESSSSGSGRELTAVRPTSRQAIAGARLGQIVNPMPQLGRQLVDIPTFLIQHWFKSVCSGWSAYDNQFNPYRQLSGALWNTSMAVFYALQSMAAASLVEHLPHLKEVSRVAPKLALQAIQYELQAFRATSNSAIVFPGGLILSLFCMSSSICWTDSRQFGLQFLKPGRAVLNCLNRYAHSLSPADRELLNFFNGCLIYEEMLRSIVSDDETDMENLASWQISPNQTTSMAPHAWTGVSPDLLRLFGKTMFLCKRSRNRCRQPEGSLEEQMVRETMDYQEAVVIEEVLLAIELPVRSDQSRADNGVATEETALQKHLDDAADAFRLSSLLQLYQTFPDLIARRLPLQVDPDGFVPYSAWLSPLALHITDILRRIPPSSSMRCLQPLLCLCAGTGLRYDTITTTSPVQEEARLFGVPPTLGTAFGPPSSSSTAPSIFDFSFSLPSGVIGENELEVASARRFLMERLGCLEQSLPPKPIQVEKQLLKHVWATYDFETQTDCKTHWLDIMVNNGLESIFG